MQSQEGSATIAYEAFDAERHLTGVVEMCRSLEWDNFRCDPDPTRGSLTSPGATAMVAVAPEGAMDEKWRRRGTGRRLVEGAFARVGAVRTDLLASDESPDFYRSLRHREQVGFRVYPGREEEG